MQRFLLALFSFGLIATTVLAQGARTIPGFVPQRIAALTASGVNFQHRSLLAPVAKSAATDEPWRSVVRNANVFSLDHAATAQVLMDRPAFVALDISSNEGMITLDLERVDFTTDDFSVITASTGATVNYMQGVHYRGAVHGDPNSLVAISIFKNEVMGIVSAGDGDRVIGKLDGDAQDRHIIYRVSDLLDPALPVCGTVDDGQGYSADQLTIQEGDRTVKCVRLYWEVNYDIFQGKGSVAAATNYVTGLFNQSAAQYANDGISVSLSQVFVWDVASPYTSTSTSTLLDQFGAYRTSFNGDLAHLLGYAGGGGIAWVSGLCNSNTAHKMAYSGISTSFSNIPAYSWSVEVVTHEQGHLLGSQHTHACVWNGNNTAIDGCGPTANSNYSEGSCPIGPVPSSSVGGTIMSYCHLISAGIHFANGFGPQPTALIVNNINNASCLTACSGVTCGIPAGLNASAVTTTSATLGWGLVSGATSYILRWKLTSSSTWTTVNGLTSTSYSLTGLALNTAYDFQVQSVCSGGSSAFSGTTSFTTLNTTSCPDIQEPNNTLATAGTIAPATNYNAVIASTTDVDYYKFVITATSNLTVALSNLPFDYDVTLLNSGGTQLGSSAAGGTTSESISYANAAPGTYYVNVYGYNSAFSTSSCYLLRITATAVAACTDAYEPNETNTTPRIIAANGSINALIGSATDKDWFQFPNTSAQRNIKVTLTNLPADYDLKLFRSATQLAISQNTGTTNEQILYNTTTISNYYRVKVYPKSTAFSTSQCYTLTTQISSTAFMPEAIEGGAEDAWKDEGSIRIFPNPASSAVNIMVPASDVETTIEMIDAMGRTVMSMTQANANGQSNLIIDVSAQPVGIYLVRATQGDHTTVQRLAVQH